MVSWGVLLQDAQRVQVVVLCFNFLGDGIRDACDPFST